MSNIFQEEENQFKISRADANQLIPSLESVYYGLLIQGKYLPKQTSSIITSEYLLDLLFEKINTLINLKFKSGCQKIFSYIKDKQMEADKQKKILKKKNLESKMDRKLKIIDDNEKELKLIENKIKDIEGE